MPNCSRNNLRLLAPLVFSLLLTSCHLATKGDIAELRREIRDAKEETTEEVRAGVQEQSERQAAQVARVERVVLARIPEPRSLGGMFLDSPWWVQGVIGWAGSATFFLVLAFVGHWRDVSLAVIMRNEDGALSFMEMMIKKIRSRRQGPLEDPDPPEDDGPQLRVVK